MEVAMIGDMETRRGMRTTFQCKMCMGFETCFHSGMLSKISAFRTPQVAALARGDF